MKRRVNQTPSFPIEWISILLLLVPLLSFPLASDNQQPAILTADSADLNRQTGFSHFHGHVHFDQGTTHIRSDDGFIQTNQRNQLIKATAISQSNELVHYQTLVKLGNPIIEAKAKTIIWQPLTQKITLIGKASVTQGTNSYSAPHIVYDIVKQHVVSSPSKDGQLIIHFRQKKSSDKYTQHGSTSWAKK